MASSDDRLEKVKGDLKSIYLAKLNETKGGNDKKRAACRAIHDQLKPSELCLSELDWADSENVKPMATPAKHDDPLQKEQNFVKRFETPSGKDEKGAAGGTHESDGIKAKAKRELFRSESPTPQPSVIKSGGTDKETLKEESASASPTPQSPVINFKSGRTNREPLKEELYKAVESVVRSKAEENIKTFVDNHIKKNEMSGPVSVSGNTVKKANYTEYISCKVIELSLAGQVVWDTEDGKAAKGTTDFWKFKYKERRLIEASQLYSLRKEMHVPQKKEDLLPLMYWKEKAEGDTTACSWVESSRTEDGGEILEKGRSPPTWATDYIERIENVRGEEMQKFRKEEIDDEEPNKHPNAVYLLLCRFNGKRVPEDARVQAYAGRSKHGVEKRWAQPAQHASRSKAVVENYRKSEKFLLVDVIVGRLYAQGGRKYITEMDVKTHDNIVLFVYRTYGTEKDMKKAETDIIEKLKLTDMKRGMNGRR